MKEDYIAEVYRVVLIGNSGAGKTSLLDRFGLGEFREQYMCTPGVDFRIKKIDIGEKVKIFGLDTAGQERFRNQLPQYYFRNMQGFICVYDITDRQSFTELDFWIKMVETNSKESVKIILIGTKCDLSDKRQVSYQEGLEFANILGMHFYETSSRNGFNVDEAFSSLGSQILDARKRRQGTRRKQKIDTIKQILPPKEKTKNTCYN